MASPIALDFRPIVWEADKVRLIDQTRLPIDEVWLEISDYRELTAAIRDMKIRGAPAIGVAGAYAVALAARELVKGQPDKFLSGLEAAAREIEQARPTAVNLAWAVKRMMQLTKQTSDSEDFVARLTNEAIRIHDEDVRANHQMGRFGAELIPHQSAILTHCNTGALATGGYGTALGVIRSAWADGRLTRVYATETRPFLQGARLTAWELVNADITASLIPDSAAGQLMRRGKVQSVIVGADRIAANGDVANKIGTYSLAVLAKENEIPFYVAAPTSTVDLDLESGDAIPIEERSSDEVTQIGGIRIAPEEIEALNPAFDVTPHKYVTAIITERGVVTEPYDKALAEVVSGANA